MKSPELPAGFQALGLACLHNQDMPPGDAALGRKPVAGAVVTLQTRADRHRGIIAATLSDARDTEFPLPWLVDQALSGRAPAIITPEDHAPLRVDAMARRFLAEPRLAAICAGEQAIDPTAMFGSRIDEA